MAQLTVRNLDATLVAALKRRAARHGRSAEAEHRTILREALAGEAEPEREAAFARLAELRTALAPKLAGIDTLAILRADRDRDDRAGDGGSGGGGSGGGEPEA